MSSAQPSLLAPAVAKEAQTPQAGTGSCALASSSRVALDSFSLHISDHINLWQRELGQVGPRVGQSYHLRLALNASPTHMPAVLH